VVGIDTDGEKVEKVRNANPPIFEPDLSTLLKETVSNGNLRVAQDSSADSEFELAQMNTCLPSFEPHARTQS
jgi:UDP-glucose 6-dehydrogenase